MLLRTNLSLLILALVAPLAAANATVITYDDIGMPGQYTGQFADQGYQFNDTMNVIDISAGSLWAANGPAVSGNYAALNNYYGEGSFSKVGGGTFSFSGTYIKDWANLGLGGSINGFLNGALVDTVQFNTVGANWDLVAADFAKVDTVSIDPDGGQPFLIDNTYVNQSISPVPLPGSLPMFGAALLGLAGIGMKSRRRVTA